MLHISKRIPNALEPIIRLQIHEFLQVKFRAICTASSPFSSDTSSHSIPPPPEPDETPSLRKKRRKKPDPFAPPLPPSSFNSYSGQDNFKFKVIHQSKRSKARVCRIETPHGPIDTPGYVPVATNAALKALELNVADIQGLQLTFANTYHLMLQPSSEVIEQAGGLHKFMSRRLDRPLITDSGGFQVFSLAYGTVHQELHSLKRSASGKRAAGSSGSRDGNLVLKVSEEGVTFRSYRDGTRMLLTPESSIAAQKSLAADIILPLDELPPYHIDDQALAASVARSHRWEARSLLAHVEHPQNQACYGIVHGGSSLDLRRQSAQYIASLPFDGFAVGGALGKDRAELFHIMQHVMRWLPRDRPVHCLGIADPESILQLAVLGIDTFDSCFATRLGRHGGLLRREGVLRVAASGNKTAHRPPIEDCSCPTCSTYSLSYLHHLHKAKEPLLATLLSLHNVSFMCQMMQQLRESILDDAL